MKNILIIIIVLFVSLAAFSQNNKEDKKNKPYLNFSIALHTDLIYDINQMDPAWYAGFRPSKIPIYPGDPGWGTDGHTYFSMQQSTFKTDAFIPVNHKWNRIKLHITFDLYGTEDQAGKTVPRFRTGYGEWGPLLIGKEWSTFVDLDAFPYNYDWWGPSGMALMSGAMLRYTHNFNLKNKVEAAIELPGSDIDPGQLREIDPSLVNFKTKEVLPDLITRYTRSGKWGYVKGALLLRQLSYEILSEQTEKAVANNKFGWAFNFTSRINVFKDRGAFQFQTVFGHGYAGYNNDGGVEIAPNANYQAEVPFQYGFVAAYDYTFADRLTLSVVYSETKENNTEGQLDNAFHNSRYLVSQVIYQIIKNTLMAGVNYQWGRLYNKALDSARDQRVMFSARYMFNWGTGAVNTLR